MRFSDLALDKMGVGGIPLKISNNEPIIRWVSVYSLYYLCGQSYVCPGWYCLQAPSKGKYKSSGGR